QARLESLANRRMRDRLQPSAPVRVGENDGAERLAVERAGGGQDILPELVGDLREGRLTRRDHLARKQIRVDDLAAERAKDTRYGALPSRDAAGQPDEQELTGRAHPSAQSAPVFTSTTTGTFSGSAAAMISRASVSTAATSSGGASKRSS